MSLTRYPSRGFTNTTNNQTLPEGLYSVNASSWFSPGGSNQFHPMKLFDYSYDKVSDEGWHTGGSPGESPFGGGNYILNAAGVSGGYVGNYYLDNESSYKGQWVTLTLPKKIVLQKINIIAHSNYNFINRRPNKFRIYGKNSNETNWNIIYDNLSSTYVNRICTINLNNTSNQGYNNIAFVINSVLVSDSNKSVDILHFQELELYATDPIFNIIEIGMISNTLKTNNSSINDGLIRMNDKKLILQSGSGNPSLIVDTLNNIGIGKNTPTDNFDISGSVIVSNYRIHKQTIPIIDSSGNINTIGNLTINNNLALSNNNFSINSTTGNVFMNDSLLLGNKLSINTNKFSIDASGNIKSSGNFDISNNLNINNYTLIDSSGSVILNSLDVSNNTNFKNNLSIQNKLDANCLLSDVSFNKVCINNKNLDPSYNFHVVGDSHIVGDLTVNGNVTIMDTIQETTEQLIINNNGIGPAMTINQIGAQPIIDFQDDNKSVFYIADNGLVGIGHSQPNYTLDVSGTVYFLNNLDVSGNLHLLNNISSSNNAKFNNTVDISNNLNINNKFYVDSSGNADTSGNVIVHGSLISKGVLNQNGIFAQSGDTTIDGSLTVRKNIDLSNNLTVNTNSFVADISGNIKASGNFDLSNNFSSNLFNIDNFGNIKVPNNIYLNNSLSVNNFKVNFIGDISSNGTLDISKNFSINTNKFIIDSSGNLFSNGTLDISNNLSVNTNKFTVDSSGNIKSVGTLDLSNNFTINTNKFTVDSNGNIQLLGNLDLSRNLTVNTNKFSVDNLGNTKTLGYLNMFGNFSINNNNFIANNTSGDLKVKGTLDLSKNLIGGNGNFTVDSSGNTKVKGTLDISKNLTVSNVLYVKNNKVGINNSNPSYECDVSGNIGTLNTYLGNVNSNAGFGYRSAYINTNYAIMQTSTGKSTINSKDNIYFTFGGVSKCKLDSSGNVILNGNIYEYSDLNIKKNIETIDLALDKVKGLNGVTYNLTNKEDNRRHIGLIAQDVEKVIPEAVEEDDNIKTVAYGNLVGLLIEAVKELDEKLN